MAVLYLLSVSIRLDIILCIPLNLGLSSMAFTGLGLAALYYGSLASCGVIAIPAGVTTALNVGGGISTVWGSFRTTEAAFKQWADYYEENMVP